MNTELKVTSNLNGLARRLVVESIMDEATADNACTQSNKKNKTLLSWLIKNKAADPAALASAASDEYGIPLIDISGFRPGPGAHQPGQRSADRKTPGLAPAPAGQPALHRNDGSDRSRSHR